jgi:hypothetical protein
MAGAVHLMARQLWLADALRNQGLRVVEVAGWQTRGSDDFNPRGSVNHHTAGASTGNFPSLSILIYGRKDLPGPLCNVGMARDCTVYVIAAGRANHAGSGSWRGLTGNSSVLGLEPENDGRQPWTPAQVDAMVRVHAAFARGARFDPANVCQHREWTSRKPDAHSIDGAWFRSQVAARLNPAPVPPTPTPVRPTRRKPMQVLRGKATPHVWLTDGVTKRHLTDTAEVDTWLFLTGNTQVGVVEQWVVDRIRTV